ncbi:HAD family hydrolase [Promicromonospora iranensis]|uniref:HAD superfamily hydrolase (TIGR01484 family) n=1 Tax=Promicromonospora iranensis TaxID=1105144 RepID=A0ABU2CV30_9MICO|nr:HAD-IIB family hydrolase [Promicromonospora iranensis]MDR7385194.1 HAD superfamily hydrolase (TIGR01484 family) [Promicromonospora iranensis]
MTSATPQRTARPTELTAPALVACDIDGTLLDTGHPPTVAVRAAVERVRAAGHHIVLATGRSLVGALDAVDVLGLDDVWVVASNGAVTAHVTGREYRVTDLHEVEPEAAVRVAVEAMPGIRVAAELVGVGYRVNIQFPDGELNGEQHSVDTLEELWADATPRLALYGPAAFGLAPILRAMSLTVIETRPDWLDVTPPALSKATALDKVRRHLGIEYRATGAIGDGENDLEMLRWATQSIAMGHAPAHVRAVADREAGTIDDDGAAEALLSLLG